MLTSCVDHSDSLAGVSGVHIHMGDSSDIAPIMSSCFFGKGCAHTEGRRNADLGWKNGTGLRSSETHRDTVARGPPVDLIRLDSLVPRRTRTVQYAHAWAVLHPRTSVSPGHAHGRDPWTVDLDAGDETRTIQYRVWRANLPLPGYI